jgi:hypothetical protein
MAESPSQRKVKAFSLLIIGSVATFGLFFSAKRVEPDLLRGPLVLLLLLVGPVLLATWAVLSILELAAWRRSARAKAATADLSPHWVLWMGLTMLLIGASPGLTRRCSLAPTTSRRGACWGP